jgi:CSLREA domain-containing protein
VADRNRRFAFAAVAFSFFLLAMAGLARAATIFVTTEADPAGAAGTCSLRQAITNANGKNQSGSTNCAAGTGTDLIQINVGTIVLASTLPAIANTLTISLGFEISGGGTVQLMVVNPGATLTLQSQDLVDGSVTGPIAGDGEGGAILNNGTLIVRGCTFFGNQATGGANGANGKGGAIFNNGALTVIDGTFSSNTATGGAGTGGSMGGLGLGGAIYNNAGTMTVTESTFSGNQATAGSGTPAGLGNGGAITNNATLTVTDSTFSANQATATGGAIANNATLSVTNSTFSANQASTNGGAIISDGTVTVVNGTFSGNLANMAGSGGALCLDSGTVTLKGSILAGSTPNNCNTTLTDGGYNIADDSSCGFSKTGMADNGDGIDPMLASGLANNGGITETIALLTGSAAIAQIPTSPTNACTDANGNPLTTDQRGLQRPAPGETKCCIGAFEFSDPTATDTATPTPSPFGTAPATPTATPTPSAATATATATPTATPTAVPVTLKIKPKALKFAKTTVGTPSKPKNVKVSNPKGDKKHPGMAALIEMISGPAVFTETNNCPASLAAGSSCTISVTFTPSAATKQTGTLTITDNAHGGMQTVPLSGTGK